MTSFKHNILNSGKLDSSVVTWFISIRIPIDFVSTNVIGHSSYCSSQGVKNKSSTNQAMKRLSTT